MDYIINPVVMGGLVKEVREDTVKVFLHGRLGILTVPYRLFISDEPVAPGHELKFYFSYIQVTEYPLDYDLSELRPELELSPTLVGGTISQVDDTAIQADIIDDLGTVSVPRRWVFTPLPLEEGQHVEFYLSCMRVVGKRDIPELFN